MPDGIYLMSCFPSARQTKIGTTCCRKKRRLSLFQERKVFSEGVITLVTTLFSLLLARIYWMGLSPPEFSPSDNPAADHPSLLTRTLTFLFLPAFNARLLFLPDTLSFDWSMDSIPLLHSLNDVRNIATVLFYAILILLSLRLWKQLVSLPISPGVSPREFLRLDSPRCLLLSLAFLVLPFLPATNLFFYVGFVVAERILYLPSLGYCLLVGQGLRHLDSLCRQCIPPRLPHQLIRTLAALLLLLFLLRSLRRNQDWLSEEKLYRAGIPFNPAKAYGNLGNILSAEGQKEQAERAYILALSYRKNMADVHYNLGLLYQELRRYEESLSCYKTAIHYRSRMAMAYLNSGIVLNLLGRNQEAKEMYTICSQLDGKGLKDPRTHEATRTSALFNLGRIHAEEGNYEEAIEAYLDAVNRMPPHYQPQGLYNMLGEAYFKLGRLLEAEHWYLQALETKPDHLPAHLTYGKLLSKLARVQEAEQWFLKALKLAPSDPTDATSHMNLGAMLHVNGKFEEAEASYLEALRLKPDDGITRGNLQKLRQMTQHNKTNGNEGSSGPRRRR
ncbi:unnamed protein product [Cyprideis torosa]|uniref:dolichyl-phosphate-mannose--protein mannosyltransferase n=1 Tax=Cyprideis torosa TaxID=163714 RepID=A0A7R8WD50_9CRUS|nr:unnamed protein product [Cyprideis torosa]CAG0894187.1 unnamed protein product [Cyprideis torosa]